MFEPMIRETAQNLNEVRCVRGWMFVSEIIHAKNAELKTDSYYVLRDYHDKSYE